MAGILEPNPTVTTYSDSWQISTLEKKTILTYTNVVTAVHWRYQRTKTVEGPLIKNNISINIVEEVYGVTEVSFNPNSFIPFVNLTKSDITGWVEASLDMNILTTTLANKVEATSARNQQSI
jgi:hypothetical protein